MNGGLSHFEDLTLTVRTKTTNTMLMLVMYSLFLGIEPSYPIYAINNNKSLPCIVLVQPSSLLYVSKYLASNHQDCSEVSSLMSTNEHF